MKIHYTLDDSAARLPLAIRSVDNVWDRTTDLRNAPGIHLVELTTQHMLTTGATLTDELERYFDPENTHESDPYGLEQCYSARAQLEDLLRDLVDAPLTAFEEVEALFPVMHDINFLLALTVVGYPAFGYVRTYKDSEGEEYHGMVINLTQAHPHLESLFDEFSLSLLISTIRHGFFNHEGFLIAYDEYCETVGRGPLKALSRLKNALLSRGIAWYLSYHHSQDFYDKLLGFDSDYLAAQVEQWNTLLTSAYKRKGGDDLLDDWAGQRETRLPGNMCIDVVGYFAARCIAESDGNKGLRDCIVHGPDYFIDRYNTLGKHWVKA